MANSANIIRENWNRIQQEVASAASVTSRDESEVCVVAVSKTVDLDAVEAAASCGIVDFGESRTTEFLRKYEAFPHLRWHFIGTLQSNKVKDVVGRAALIHSVDSLKLLKRIDMIAERKGVVQPVLLQINVSGEESKHGFSEEEVLAHTDEIANLEHVSVQGLMTMAPKGSPDVAKDVFCRLCKLRGLLVDKFEKIDSLFAEQFCELSMGMSEDFSVAVREGATIVRIGRLLFEEQ